MLCCRSFVAELYFWFSFLLACQQRGWSSRNCKISFSNDAMTSRVIARIWLEPNSRGQAGQHLDHWATRFWSAPHSFYRRLWIRGSTLQVWCLQRRPLCQRRSCMHVHGVCLHGIELLRDVFTMPTTGLACKLQCLPHKAKLLLFIKPYKLFRLNIMKFSWSS